MKRSACEINKIIPPQYREVILEVLGRYPELRNTRIRFLLKKKHTVPYGTTPDTSSLFRGKGKRSYTVTIREEADAPLEEALFCNLTRDMQKGVLAHELIHVMQFEARSSIGLIKLVCGLVRQSALREMEVAADRGAVEHGFGRELYEHAAYIRTIRGYMQARPAIHKNYMEPEEILDYMEALEGPEK